MDVLNNAFARVNAIKSGDFRGAFRSKQTVFIEKHPENPNKYVLRFGEGKDDYIPVAGDAKSREAMREILSKVMESPAQRKKIQDMPVEKRPELVIERGGNFCGCCDGHRIVISESMGTGYKAAATFVHEMQHQNQDTHDGIMHYKKGLSLAEDILDDRLCESAAETAAYQYMYEMKDANPQARRVYMRARTSGGYSQGLCDYAAAKEAGLDEPSCVLAGMRGYASNYYIARSYEMDYHWDIRMGIGRKLDSYADYLHDGLKEREITKINSGLSGDRLDEVAAFGSHTVGMTEVPPTPEQIKETVRSPEYAFVTRETANVLKEYTDRYQQLTGQNHPKKDEVFSVRDEDGVHPSTEPEKTVVHHRSFREKLHDAIHKVGSRKETGSSERGVPFKPVVLDVYNGENVLLSLDGRKKDLKNFTAALYYKPDLSYKNFNDIPGPVSKLYNREDKLNGVLSIVLKDEKLRSELAEHGSENPLVVGFSKKSDVKTDLPTIVLDPRKSPEELAEDFKKQYEKLKEKDSRSVEQKKTEKSGEKKGFFKGLSNVYQKRDNAARAVQAARAAALRQGDK